MEQRRMLLTGYNRSTRIKTRPSAVLSTTDLTQIGPGSNPGFGEEGAGANCLKETWQAFSRSPICEKALVFFKVFLVRATCS
jgi:hypothetical protein